MPESNFNCNYEQYIGTDENGFVSKDGPAADQRHSYLQEAVGLAWDLAAMPKDVKWSSTKTEVAATAGSVLKSVPLFMKGKYAMPTALVLHALDEMHPDDSLARQTIDGGLGSMKGVLTKGAFDVFGKAEISVGTRALYLGASARAIDLGLSSDTYIRDGKFYSDGFSDTLLATFRPQSVGLDVVAAYSTAHLLRGADKLVGGRINASPYFSTIASGATYGFVRGAATEGQTRYLHGQSLDARKLFHSAVREGLINAIAAVPGGLQEHRAYMNKTMEPGAAARYDYWRDYRALKTAGGAVPGKVMSYDEYALGDRTQLPPLSVHAMKRELDAIISSTRKALQGDSTGR